MSKGKEASTNFSDELYQNILKEEVFISNLIDTIPAKYYFDRETVKRLTDSLHERVDEKVEGQKRKKKLSAKGKHKLARLDPAYYKPVSQILRELHKNDLKVRKKSKRKAGLILPKINSSRASNLTELKNRLSEKLGNLRGNRKVTDNTQKAELRKQRNQAKKLKKKSKSKPHVEKGSGMNGIDHVEKKPAELTSKPKPVFNKEGKIVFSKFDFSECKDTKKTTIKKDLKKTLFKVKKEREELKELEEKDPHRAKEVKEKKLWLKALDQSEGVKLKDNPELLKKSIKKREQQKKQSQKKWQARQEFTEKKKKEQQEKRKKNIQARKKEKLQNKLKKAKKKGRLVSKV